MAELKTRRTVGYDGSSTRLRRRYMW